MYPKPALLAELGFAIVRARFGKLFGRSSKKAEPSSANGQSFSVPKSLVFWGCINFASVLKVCYCPGPEERYLADLLARHCRTLPSHIYAYRQWWASTEQYISCYSACDLDCILEATEV